MKGLNPKSERHHVTYETESFLKKSHIRTSENDDLCMFYTTEC